MKKSQNERILNYLIKNREGITPLEALKLFGSFRLSARIKDLRNQGHRIETGMARVKTRFGWTYVANYRLPLFKRSR